MTQNPNCLDGFTAEITQEDAAKAAQTIETAQAQIIATALLEAGRLAEADIWAAAVLAIHPAACDLLMATSRRWLREGRAAEAFALLARGISAAPQDASLLMLASRLVNATKAAAPCLAALHQAAQTQPAAPRAQEAFVRACLAAERAAETADALPGLAAEAARRASIALLMGDVAAANGDFTVALTWLDQSDQLATPAEAARSDSGPRRRLWVHRRDLAKAASGGVTAADWAALGHRIAADGLPDLSWDAVIASARSAGCLAALSEPLSQALNDPALQSRLEPIFLEAAADPIAAAARLGQLPLSDPRALQIDALLSGAGANEAANRCAEAYLTTRPDFLPLARCLIRRLVKAFDFAAIDRLCAAGMAAAPADFRWAQLWSGHLASTSRFSQAAQCCANAIAAGADSVGLHQSLANFHLRNGSPDLALAAQQVAVARYDDSPELSVIAAEAYAALGQRTALQSAITAARTQAASVMPAVLPEASQRAKPRYDRLTTQLDWLQIQLDTGDILARVPVAEPRRGVVAVLVQKSPLMLIWSALTACELRGRGYETVFLDAPAVMPAAPSDPALARFHGIVDASGRKLADQPLASAAAPDWQIDPASRRMTKAGYQLHQAVSERIATSQRRYSIVPGVQADGIRDDALLRADAAIAVCAALTDWLRASGQRLLIFSTMTHYAPTCVYKQFCDSHAAPKSGAPSGLAAEYVEFNVGYEQYKSNQVDDVGSSVSVANLTRNPGQRISIHTTERAFASWLARQQLDDRLDAASPHTSSEDASPDAGLGKQAMAILHLDRSKRERPPEAKAVLDRIEAHRARGGRVVCVLGKITYDIAIEQEGGPAHADMTDWLNHSIDVVRGQDDVLLLIKPHPYEILPEIANPTEFFTDLISPTPPDNCIVLAHRWFNLSELMPLVDLVSIWHGTATLEVLAQGVPMVVGASWGIKDHPIAVIAPQDRGDYRRILLSRDMTPVGDALRRRAQLLISYLVSDEVIVPYPYGRLSALRAAKGRRWGWNSDLVETYLQRGDPHIRYLADLAEWGEYRPPTGA